MSKTEIKIGDSLGDHTMVSPELYEKVCAIWPWNRLIERTVEWITKNAQPSACIIDYMCGSADLLAQLQDRRRDLIAIGCDELEEYIAHAKKSLPDVHFICQDVFLFKPDPKPDIVVCTAGIHHLPYERQGEFIKKISLELSTDGIFIIGEEVLRSKNSDKERKLAVVEKTQALLQYLIERDASDDMLYSAAHLLVTDLLERGEFKLTLSELLDMLKDDFEIVHQEHIWPEGKPEFGDWLLICRKK